jgi:DNA polymerase I
MSRYCFDIETDGLLDDITKVHCVVLKDIDTTEIFKYGPLEVLTALDKITQASLLIGHNIIGYDIPALVKLYNCTIEAELFDTLVATRLLYVDIKDKDFRNINSGFPTKLIGRHSLKAWGHRLGEYKEEIETDWQEYTQEMLDYCVQDVEVTHALYNKIKKENSSEEALALEHKIQKICVQMTTNGIGFDVTRAQKLYATLCQRRTELEFKLQEIFPPWQESSLFIPKVNNKSRGYVKGIPVEKIKEIVFNPGSRDHIVDRLKTLRSWKPKSFTNDGKPKMDEEILSQLKFPEARLLSEYFLIQKRIGMLAEGNQAWLKQEVNGRIYGSINPNGAVTGRATHSHPNLAQVPAVHTLYGKDCRSLFCAPKGKILIGIDMSGLELRMLAHYMARYDSGAYADIVVNGDIHTHNQEAAGIETRDLAKRFIYAFLYGAGTAKLGQVVGGNATDGKELKVKFLEKLPALNELIQQVQDKAERGYLVGLDKRKIPVRSSHAALNSLLQGAGAIACKEWIIQLSPIFDGETKLVAWVHDEIIIETTEEKSQDVASEAIKAIERTSGSLQLRVKLTGEAQTGADWSVIH